MGDWTRNKFRITEFRALKTTRRNLQKATLDEEEPPLDSEENQEAEKVPEEGKDNSEDKYNEDEESQESEDKSEEESEENPENEDASEENQSCLLIVRL